MGLEAPEFFIEGFLAVDEVLVRAFFHNPSVFHDHDLISAGNGRQTVGDDDGGFVLGGFPKSVLDNFFGMGIELGSGLVKDDDVGVGQDHPGNGQTLFLAAGKFDAAFADLSAEFLR